MRLVLSRQIRYLAGRDELMLYHDGTGAALMLTEGARRALQRAAGILEAWRVPGPRGQRTDEAAGHESLVAWRFLVPETTNEREALLGWFPLRSPWCAFYANPDGSVVLARTDRSTGKPTLEVLPPALAHFWGACDGTQPLCDILAEAGDAAAPRLGAVLETWTRWDHQLLKWLPQPLGRYAEAGLPGPVLSHGKHLADRGTQPPADAVKVDAEATARELADYHTDQIRDAAEQFDERETTLSHLYRVPHPCLGVEQRRAWQRCSTLAPVPRPAPVPGRASVRRAGGRGPGRARPARPAPSSHAPVHQARRASSRRALPEPLQGPAPAQAGGT